MSNSITEMTIAIKTACGLHNFSRQSKSQENILLAIEILTFHN